LLYGCGLYLAPVAGDWTVKTDHWFYGLFQSVPDLITLLLPGGGHVTPSLGPDAPGDALYRFEAPELKAVNHRLDGALWPRGSESGTPEQPVVLLEVQMQGTAEFKHRLAAQSFRFLQLHPQVLHLAVVVVVSNERLRLGPAELPFQLEAFLAGVHWLSLEELGQQPGLDPLLSLLTLPVLPKPEIRSATDRILKPRPDLVEAVLSILGERFPHLTREEIMALINLPTDHLRHTRLAQDWMAEGEARGRLEGEARGRTAEAAAVALRQLNRRCGPLSEGTSARIQALPLEQLEGLTEALLDFSGPADLAAWLVQHGG
jgi:predicted transposase YdaD